MFYILYGIILVINMIFAFKKKHSKIAAIITFLFIWILFWGNTFNADFQNYMYSYDNVMNIPIGTEFGFYFIMYFFNKLGFTYHLFIAIVTLICYIIIFLVVKKYTSNYNFILSFYMIHMMFFDIIQIRNFIAMSILIKAIDYLICNTAKDKIKYIILILVASTIHNSFIFYLILLCINTGNLKKLIKLMVLFSLCGSIITIINNGQIPILSKYLQTLLADSYKLNYLRVKTPIRYIFSLYLLQIISYIFVKYSKYLVNLRIKHLGINKLFRYNTKANINQNIINLFDKVFLINLLAFSLFPFYIQSINFYRLMRNFNILYFIVLAISSEKLIRGTINKFLFNILFLLLPYSWFIFDLSMSFYHVKNILENNIFLEL